jgi:hypothetical protein
VAAPPRGGGPERLVGFAAAALGLVAEFATEACHLTASLQASLAAGAGGGGGSGDERSGGDDDEASGGVSGGGGGGGAAPAASMAPATDGGGSGSERARAAGRAAAQAAAAAAAPDALALEVVLLGVVAGCRRQGVASRLLQQLTRHGRAVG